MQSADLERKLIERSIAEGEEAIILGRVLRIGVSIAGVLVLVGLALFFIGGHGGPANLDAALGKGVEIQRTSPRDIVDGLRAGSSGSFILLGLLVLILTPTVRVAMTAVFFARHKDWTFVILAGIVLVLLLIGLVGIGA